jgi:hypothetical protein
VPPFLLGQPHVHGLQGNIVYELVLVVLSAAGPFAQENRPTTAKNGPKPRPGPSFATVEPRPVI